MIKYTYRNNPEIFNEKNRHFGGIIYLSDFNTDYRRNTTIVPSIAYRIEMDMRWEQRLIEKAKQKNSL